MKSEASESGSYHLDHGTSHYVCSSEVLQLFEVSSRDFDGCERTLLAKVHPDDRTGTHIAIAGSRRSREVSRFGFRVVLRDGSVRRLEAREQTFLDKAGQAIRTLGLYRHLGTFGNGKSLSLNVKPELFRDNPGATMDEIHALREALRIEVARREAAEASSARSEQRLRVIFDEASQFSAILSIDGVYLEVNQTALNIRGKHREDLIGRHFWDIPDSIFNQQTCELMIDMLDRAVLGRPVRELVEIHRGDPVWLILDLTMKPIHDAKGRVEMILCEARDVGKIYRAEFEAKLAREEAERKTRQLEQQSAELALARDQALASVRARTDFLANVSHEIRSPMTSILGSAEILLDPTLARVEQEQHVIAIRRNGEHLLRIINDILDLSKSEANKLELEFQSYSPWQLMHEVLSTLQVRAEERRVRLNALPTGSLPSAMMMDPTRLRQIILNLVGNAIKFSKPGGEVSIRMGATKQVNTKPTSLYVEVEDRGIGIHQDHLEKIFQPFEQADGTMSRRFGGTGLGLSIVHRLVEAMRGSIEVRSQVGEGSLFRVEIPDNSPSPEENWVQADNLNVAPTQPKRLLKGLPGQKLQGRVLLAEDHEDNQKILLFHLKRVGLSVEVAQNGLEAVEKAMNRAFDLILMDMQMPDLDGYGAVRVLRRSGYRGKIIALTAHAMLEDRGRCLEVGCDDYLAKPVDPHRLIETIGEVLKRTKAESRDDAVRS